MNKVTLLKELQLSTYIALDLETTGLDPYRCGITEVSAYRFIDGEPVEEFTTLIDPERAIPKEISELTGITPDMIYGKPKIWTGWKIDKKNKKLLYVPNSKEFLLV